MTRLLVPRQRTAAPVSGPLMLGELFTPPVPVVHPLAGRHVLVVEGSGAADIVAHVSSHAEHVTVLTGWRQLLPTRLRRRPDVVVVVTPTAFGTPAVAGIARRYRVPVVTVAREATITGRRRALRRRPDLVIVSRAFREQAAIGREPARAVLGWPFEPFTVVSLGGGGDRRTFTAAGRRFAAGTGVRFATAPRNGTFPLALAASDVVVVNERADGGEPAPGVVEAFLAAGRPVVAAVAPGGPTARALGRTEGAALLVPAGDPSALAAAVQELREDPRRRARMAGRAGDHARSALGQVAAMTRLDEVIAEVLG
jgi:hypothetical protein